MSNKVPLHTDLTEINKPFGELDFATKLDLVMADRNGVPMEGKMKHFWDIKRNGYQFFDHEIYRVKPSVSLTKPSIDWSHVHHDFNWLARQKNGECSLFSVEPELRIPESHWENYRPNRSIIVDGFSSFYPGTCNWKDSLVCRPTGECM